MCEATGNCIGPTTPYLVLVVALVLFGCGMSLTAAPATGSITSAVPHAKAGVGSAVNDTARELGGAGHRRAGSIASAVYRSSIDLEGLPLPPPVRDAAEESVGAATVISKGLPGGGELASRAGTAFTEAFNVTSRVAVAMTLAAAAVVAAVFSRRSEVAANAQTADPSTPRIPVEPELAPDAL